MKRVIIDGKKMQNKNDVHAYLQEKLQIQTYFGNNLDALWDAISTHDKPLEINCKHSEVLVEVLGDYGQAVLQVFKDAAEVNPNILFKLE
ncbi:barstar family protein [Virgibacillus kimchii]